MSWRLIILPPEDADDDALLGSADDLRARLAENLPALSWAEPDEGLCDSDPVQIRIRLAAEGEVDSFMIAITGAEAADPMPAVRQICRGTDWAVFDSLIGQYLDLADPSRGGWHAYHLHASGKVIPPFES